MNKKTLGLLSVLASMLVTGCQPSKSDNSNASGNSNINSNVTNRYYENSLLDSPEGKGKKLMSLLYIKSYRFVLQGEKALFQGVFPKDCCKEDVTGVE